jgi:hypothetical protein
VLSSFAFKFDLRRYSVGREIRVLKRLAQEYIIRLFDVVGSCTLTLSNPN